MSLILDALNRSRRDADNVPGLDAHHPIAETSRPALPLVLLAAALAVALAAIGWLIWGRGEPEAPLAPAKVAPEAPAASEPEVESPRQTGQSLRPGSTAQASPPPVAIESGRAPAGVGTPAPATGNAGTGQAASPAPEVPAAAPDPEVAALYSQPRDASGGQQGDSVAASDREAAAWQPAPGSSASPPVEEEPVDVDSLLQQAEEQLEDAQLDEHPAPFLGELSQQTKDEIPTLLYSAHRYSGKLGQSSVVINGKQLKVGGNPAAGVKIEEILTDSVVLSFRGDSFRLRALNSWVNL